MLQAKYLKMPRRLLVFGGLAITAGAWFFAGQPAAADWVPPLDYPPFCTTSQPGCFLPIEPSGISQLKLGSLGVSSLNLHNRPNTADNFDFYASVLGVGNNFINSTNGAPKYPLDVEGNVRIEPGGGAVPVGTALEVLPNGVDPDAGALVGWGSKYFSLWSSASNSSANNGIYNTDGGGVGVRTGNANLVNGLTVMGALVRYGGTAFVNNLSGSPTTQVNLSTQGQTGGQYSSLRGGYLNQATANYSTVIGGRSNQATGANSFVGGGQGNRAVGVYSSVVGGSSNQANGNRSFVGGGRSNIASALGTYSAVGGGQSNVASGAGAVVLGGQSNTASGASSAVLGGRSNIASGNYAAVLGGQSNTASGINSVVLGGQNNTVTTAYAAAGGRLMRVGSVGTFAWGNNRAEIAANTANSFIVQPDFGAGSGAVPSWGYAEGAMMIGTSTPFTAGYDVRLNVDGPIVIRGVTGALPQVGARLTAIDDAGRATWQMPPASPQTTYGGSVFYMRRQDQAGDPISCPAYWCDASNGAAGCAGTPGQPPAAQPTMTEKSGGFSNSVRVCYRDDKRVRAVMTTAECVLGCGGSENAPPNCPSGFTSVYSNYNQGGEYLLGNLIKTRVCLSTGYNTP